MLRVALRRIYITIPTTLLGCVKSTTISTCGIKKKRTKTYYDNVLKQGNSALHFPNLRNGDGVQQLMASMRDDQALGEWELHTPEDMKWNDNH
jgi:hypothetical protein